MAARFHASTMLTRDMIVMGMTSVAAGTTRMNKEIVADLLYSTLRDGMATL